MNPVVVLAYDGMAADEAGVITQILADAGIEVIVAAVRSGSVTSFHGRVAATQTAGGLGPCSALIVPGGMGIRTAAADPALLDAVRSLAARSTWLGRRPRDRCSWPRPVSRPGREPPPIGSPTISSRTGG